MQQVQKQNAFLVLTSISVVFISQFALLPLFQEIIYLSFADKSDYPAN